MIKLEQGDIENCLIPVDNVYLIIKWNKRGRKVTFGQVAWVPFWKSYYFL